MRTSLGRNEIHNQLAGSFRNVTFSLWIWNLNLLDNPLKANNGIIEQTTALKWDTAHWKSVWWLRAWTWRVAGVNCAPSESTTNLISFSSNKRSPFSARLMLSCVYLFATNATNNWRMDEILPLKKVGAADTPTGSCWKCARLPFVDPFKSLFVTDATTNLIMAEDLSSKDKA